MSKSAIKIDEQKCQEFYFSSKNQIARYQYQTVQSKALPVPKNSDDNLGQAIKQEVTTTKDGFILNFIINIDGQRTVFKNHFTFYSIEESLQPRLQEMNERRIQEQEQQEQEKIQKQEEIEQSQLQQQQNQPFLRKSTLKNIVNYNSSNSHDNYSSCQLEEDSSEFYTQQQSQKCQKSSYSLCQNNNLETQPNSPNISSTCLSDNQNTPLIRPLNGNISPLKLQKISSFNSKNLDKDDFELMRADKKNIVKNVVKGFKGYLINFGLQSQIMKVIGIENFNELQNFRKQFLSYLKKKKFNNQFIIDLFRHKKYSELFKFFLKYESKNWLINSQVQDKKSHEIVLNLYIKSCDDETKLEKLKVLKCGGLRKRFMSECL